MNFSIQPFVTLHFWPQFLASLSVDNMLKIYYANVNSLISYCIMIYHTGSSSAVQKINNMHRRILKVLFRVHSCDVDMHMKKHNILDIHDTYKLRLVCLGHKMKYDKQNLPIFFKEYYKNKCRLNLRNSKDFITPFYRLNISQRSVDYAIPRVWNRLPDTCKSITSYRRFLKAIKRLLLTKNI